MTSGLTLLALIAPLALGAALSPALLAASLGILSASGERAGRTLSLCLLGAAVPLAVALAFAALPDVREPQDVRNIPDVIDLVLAAILIVVALVTAVRRTERRLGGTPSFAASRGAGPRAVGLGFVLMATNVTTMVLVVAAGRDLARTDAATLWRALGFAIVVIGALLPILVPLLWRLISPVGAASRISAVERFLARNGRPIAISVCLVTALYLIVRATLPL